eukprot:4235468-Lingulodinium_polyedra.AAC.1
MAAVREVEECDARLQADMRALEEAAGRRREISAELAALRCEIAAQPSGACTLGSVPQASALQAAVRQLTA